MTTHYTLEPSKEQPAGLVLALIDDRIALQVWAGDARIALRLSPSELADVHHFCHQLTDHVMDPAKPRPAPVTLSRVVVGKEQL